MAGCDEAPERLDSDVTALKIFFDGGCRPNPGAIEVAVVARGAVHHCLAGQGTSHEAEWAALLHALEVARELGVRDVLLVGDCANVIAQANGARCRSPELLAAYQDSMRDFARVRLRYIRRGQNLAGIALARLNAARRLEQATSSKDDPIA